MKYNKTVLGTFISRPNRFIAKVNVDNEELTVHVKNTGRCRELLVSGAQVVLEISDNPNRKTAYDLVAVYKEEHGEIPRQLINMDSQAPNKVVYEWLKDGKFQEELSLVKPEQKYGDSRMDFYLETASGKKIFMEVKGVTLERDGIASFPDAPTERGIKHINELVKAVEEGYEAYLFFVIQMKHIKLMEPDGGIHPEFAEALENATSKGVKVLSYDCIVTPDSLEIDSEVKFDIRWENNGQ